MTSAIFNRRDARHVRALERAYHISRPEAEQMFADARDDRSVRALQEAHLISREDTRGSASAEATARSRLRGPARN